jgi:hypothetical protein
VATERLRVRGAQKIAIILDAAGEHYFEEVRQARTDLLGDRFRAMPRRDLAGMQSLLLPINFGRIALGRPADEEETHVVWNGTFLMVENPTGGAWIMGESKPEPSPDRYDRWFALAAGVEKTLFGNDWTHTQTRYVDDYLPATITTHEQGGFSFAEKLYVTAPGDPVYGTVLEVDITNTSAKPGRTALTVILGRRGNFRWDRDRHSPLSFDPKLTGYYLKDDKRTIRGSDGNILLFAEPGGTWEGTPRENHLRYPLALGPKGRHTLRFFVPSVTAPIKALADVQWQAAWERFRAFWTAKLASGMKLDVPEPALNAIYKNLLAQALIITQDGPNEVKYGAYGYEMFFGVEEGWPAVALAQYGHGKSAQDIASIMLSPRIMDKSNYHHPSRNGLEPWNAATIYRLTHDREWLERIAPRLEEAAEWTIRQLHEHSGGKYAGILPRHAYGGDIDTPAYSLGANAACWRGLQDTARILRTLGRAEFAKRYQDEADAFRRRLWAVADELADHAGSPVFLPVSFDIGNGAANRAKEPAYAFLGNNTPTGDTWNYLGNYWNISAPGILELKLFEKGDPRGAWIADYMDAHGGVMAGLARFTIGFDQIYGKGYYENLLERGKRAEFWTSLYGIFAHGMSQNLYSFPEVCGVFPLRVSNSAMQHEYTRSQWDWGFQGWRNCEGEPLSAGPGMALQMLRMALVREATEDTAQDTLLLLDGAPVDWFEPGKKIAVRDAPAFFGKISFETEAFPGRVRARVVREHDFTARRVVLRLAHPLREVSINGREWKEFSGEQITLPEGNSLEISARY